MNESALQWSRPIGIGSRNLTSKSHDSSSYLRTAVVKAIEMQLGTIDGFIAADRSSIRCKKERAMTPLSLYWCASCIDDSVGNVK